MNILVTGGMGFIGSHTCISLLNQGLTPIIYDNLSNSNINVLKHLKMITGQDVTFVNSDINNKILLKKTLTQHDIKAVFHFAAFKAVGESTEFPLTYYQNNIANTLSLLEVMNEVNVKKIIFSSSATVYGEPQYVPINENHPISATNPYGQTKVMMEQILADLCKSDPQWLVITLRYFNPVGAHPSGLLGESPKGIPNNLMPYIAQTAVGTRPLVNIFGNDYPTQDGTGVRDYIHIMDLADGHVAAFDTQGNKSGFKAFNLGTGQGYSVLEVIKSFSTSSNREIHYKFSPRRAGDVACNFASTNLAKKALGWEAKYSLSDMTDHTWLWQSNYPNGTGH
jgi:UDP-glucose 4-epimerase